MASQLLCHCSKHPAAAVHAAARAVSGAAVYVSDSPGKHDFDILKQLVLPDGSVERALLPGRPTLDCLFVDPLRDAQSLLKVWVLPANPDFDHLAWSSWGLCTNYFVCRMVTGTSVTHLAFTHT